MAATTSAGPNTEAHADRPAAVPPVTLGVDIGGSNIKVAAVDASGRLLAEQVRTPTPKPATPEAVLAAIGKLVAASPGFDRISVGFPGVVRGGEVITAPNLGTPFWAGFAMIAALAERFGVPVRMLNDAVVQGLGVVEGPGLECVVTLGTGVGCALFRNRRLLVQLELGQHPARKGKSYDQYAGQAALAVKGAAAWNRRVRKVITSVLDLTNCDRLYIGGGNARKIAFQPPPQVKIVSNAAGITGGVRLWEEALDDFFVGVPMADASRYQRGR
ncbi:MAG TPA: ROK family protein [Hyphomicrobiaceae bacterium]|nr:ROK family protein [Hyphomicrobiaceae bacterium]